MYKVTHDHANVKIYWTAFKPVVKKISKGSVDKKNRVRSCLISAYTNFSRTISDRKVDGKSFSARLFRVGRYDGSTNGAKEILVGTASTGTTSLSHHGHTRNRIRERISGISHMAVQEAYHSYYFASKDYSKLTLSLPWT